MKPLKVVTLLSVFTVAYARECDDYSFCTDPGMTIVEGNYQYGQTYGDQNCLATTENAQSFSMMVAEGSHHYNGTVTVNLLSKNNDYSAAVGARLNKTDVNLDTSVCRGYTGYWCYLNRQSTKGNDEITAKLEMKKCGETSMSSLDVETSSTETITMDVGELYKLSFYFEGRYMRCGIQSYSTAYDNEDFIADIETNDNDYHEGVLGIANWGTSWYYRNSSYCALPSGPSRVPTQVPTYRPSPEPSEAPSPTPTSVPTYKPSPQPSPNPTGAPTIVPSPRPTSQPSPLPTPRPTSYPSPVPISAPSSQPTTLPTSPPSPLPTSKPTSIPTPVPTIGPTPYPSATPTPPPTSFPSHIPTPAPTGHPTYLPTAAPSHLPTALPTDVPTSEPTSAPTFIPTPSPTAEPTFSPTELPTIPPSKNPSPLPTASPSYVPSPPPTKVPSPHPTALPTITPTPPPTHVPTIAPTPEPTHLPSEVPTSAPTPLPSGLPTFKPSPAPTQSPTMVPTTPDPSQVPTYSPTQLPTPHPTSLPTPHPTRTPTLHPTGHPTYVPSPPPTEVPSYAPSESPTTVPSPHPTHMPTSFPTHQPTHLPTPNPTHAPTSLPTPHPTGVPTPFPSTWVPTSLPTNLPTMHPTNLPTPVPTYGPTPFPSPVPTDVPTHLPTSVPTVSPTTYCYDPKPADTAPVYSYIDTIGGDMVSWLYANYIEIETKVDELWLPYQGTNKGNEPGGKTHYTGDDDQGQIPDSAESFEVKDEFSPYGNKMKSTKEALELKKLVQGFTLGAHLVNDVEPENLDTMRKTTALSEQETRKKNFNELSGGVPTSTAILMAVAALALGVAFQNQRAWTEMSTARLSRAEYTTLI